MSSYVCDKCGVTQVDSEWGYISGCCHHPPEHGHYVTVYFGGDVPPAKAFYRGAWYKSEKAKSQGKAVHPVTWDAMLRSDSK
jgi:hypothetical protein